MSAQSADRRPEAGLILLVEDDPDDAALTERTLQRARLLNPVRVVASAEDALRLLQNQEYQGEVHGRRVDLILLDLGLPGMGGRELLDTIWDDRRLQRIPVIVLTSSDLVSDRLRSYKHGALGFLNKPVDVGELLRVLSDRRDAGFLFVRAQPS